MSRFIIGMKKGPGACDVVCGGTPCGEGPCNEDGTSKDGLPHYNSDGVLICGPGYEDCDPGGSYVEIQLDSDGNLTWRADSTPATVGAWRGPFSSANLIAGAGDYSLSLKSSRRSTLMGYTFDPLTPHYSTSWEIRVEAKLVVTPLVGDPYEILIPRIPVNNHTTNPFPEPRFRELECIGVQLPGAGENVQTYLRIVDFVAPTDTPPPGYGPGVTVIVGMHWMFTANGPMTMNPP